MITSQCFEHLDASYRSANTNENAEAYDAWCPTFEQEMGAMGYTNPAIAPALVERWSLSKDTKILDVGCATGLVGAYLHFLGYTNLHGVDHSNAMVKVASSKNVYQTVQQASLSGAGSLPFNDNEFDIVIPMGIFTVGHAPVSGVTELLRVLKPGGFMIFSCTAPGLALGFGDKFTELEENGHWEKVDQTRPHITIPGAPIERQYITTQFVYKKGYGR